MLFFDYLNSISKLPPAAVNAIAEKMQLEKHPKGHILHREDSICSKVYFVQKGILRVYYHKDSRDITTWFASENQMVTVPDSFFSQKPDRYNIEVLEECELLSFEYNDLEALYVKYPEVERVGRLMAIQTIIDLGERLSSINFHTAAERYKDIMENHPNIVQRVPLRHIASFLGIEQETLSRIRGKI